MLSIRISKQLLSKIPVFNQYSLLLSKHISCSVNNNRMYQTPSSPPRKLDHSQSYISPIRMLKNISSNSHEQQFFKIKARRLQTEIQDLAEQNARLKMKLADSNDLIQDYKSKVLYLESQKVNNEGVYSHRGAPSFGVDSGKYYSARDNSSLEVKYFWNGLGQDKNDKSNLQSEIERLLKQNRTIKNQHQIQLTKLKEQNQKITTKLLQFETAPYSNSNQPTHQTITSIKLEENYNRLEKINKGLREEIGQFEKQKKKLEDKAKLLDDNNKALRKQNEQLRLANSSKNRADSDLKQLQVELERLEKLHNEQVSSLSQQIEELRKNKYLEALKSSRFSNRQKAQNKNSNTATPAATKDIQTQLLKRKIAIQEQQLHDKDQQIQNILHKLKPLMDKNDKNEKQLSEITTGEKRASLSILEVFLKKYKINSF